MLTNQFKFNYSIGGIANGIKTDTFTFFLLFFYSRVIGLDPLLASSARRRHPFMFILFIPISIFYDLLCSPQSDWELTQNQLFWCVQ